ncbi:sulfurtransferase complex subunit TusD [Pseudoalteromonas sp. MMG010]|uniref:sulfurtransferase complex subunit TusD n=1 Tax=Pseudoalteromonas sp. MMG010 TaxID=2822685 RepID=UPI001B39E550|nr:sulfurtransferase complex subunit TusD [Pseudoalteromonas sp. MMG010]MBQ4832472.1 sulfurtransferase complex subunit TusD [Pseudoalteromonas sp. MMG010]
MAQFVISMHSAPSDHDTTQRLAKFVNACINQGHTVNTIFLYQDAVFHASPTFELATDELNIPSLWQNIANLGINLTFCITAAQKRGLDIENTGVFNVAGLAEFAMLASDADKWVQFK